MLSKGGISIYNLKEGSNEWESVEIKFKSTLPDSSIKMISRIQNRRLWKKFQGEFEHLSEKLDKDPLILELFHGTSNTHPD